MDSHQAAPLVALRHHVVGLDEFKAVTKVEGSAEPLTTCRTISRWRGSRPRPHTVVLATGPTVSPGCRDRRRSTRGRRSRYGIGSNHRPPRARTSWRAGPRSGWSASATRTTARTTSSFDGHRRDEASVARRRRVAPPTTVVRAIFTGRSPSGCISRRGSSTARHPEGQFDGAIDKTGRWWTMLAAAGDSTRTRASR